MIEIQYKSKTSQAARNKTMNSWRGVLDLIIQPNIEVQRIYVNGTGFTLNRFLNAYKEQLEKGE